MWREWNGYSTQSACPLSPGDIMLLLPVRSFDIVKDDLGAPRSTFPHTMFMVAGTQAASAKQNYVAFVKLANLGQGRHGKKGKAEGESSDEESDDAMSDEDMSEEEEEDHGPEGPPRMHYR